MQQVGENLSGVLDQIFYDAGLFNFVEEQLPRGAATAALRICAEITQLENQYFTLETTIALRDIQAACLEHNLKALKKFTKSRAVKDSNRYKLIIKSIETILDSIPKRASMGPVPTLKCAHPNSKSLEEARLELLNGCYAQLLHAEMNELPAEESEHAKIPVTVELAKLLLIGTPEGKLPSSELTLAAKECFVFYKKVWEYLEQIFYVYPFGAKQIAHYDHQFYEFCLKLIRDKDDVFTKNSLWLTSKKLCEEINDPQVRIRELFATLGHMLRNHIILASEQIVYKKQLRDIALCYGFDDGAVKILAYNAPQRRVCSTASVMTLCEFSFRNRPEKQGKYEIVDNAIWDLSHSEYKFMEAVNKFINGDAKTRGSLQSLMTYLKGLSMDCVYQSKIRVIEEMSALLLVDLGRFSESVSDCVIKYRDPDQKLNVLYTSIMGEDFTNYMLDLTVSTLFLEKFSNEVKALLNKTCDDVDIVNNRLFPYDENIRLGFRHLVKISEDFKQIRRSTIKTIVSLAVTMEVWDNDLDHVAILMEPWPKGSTLRNQLMHRWPVGADQLLRVIQMEERTAYFLHLANTLSTFLSDAIPHNHGEALQPKNKLNELLGEKCAAEIPKLCAHWLELWEMGALSIDLVRDKLAKAISGDLCVECVDETVITKPNC